MTDTRTPVMEPVASHRPSAPAGRSSRRWIGFHVGILVSAVALWAVSVADVHVGDMGGLGLVDALPLGYFAAFGVLSVGFAAAVARSRPPTRILWVYVVGFVVMLEATAPLVYAQPRFAWTYKHLGVIEFISSAGRTDRSLDIYNNWPGFFALNAWLKRLTGVAPITYAAWAPVFFGIVNVLVVRFALRGLTADDRLLWTATWIFVLTNWLGGEYLAPQPMAFILGVVTVGLCVRCAPSRRRPVLAWLRTRLPGSGPDGRAHTGGGRPPLSPRSAFVVGGLCYLAIVVSHQLSPVIVIAQVSVLSLAVRRIPPWIPLEMLAIELLWVGLAWPFLNGRFELFAFHPFAKPEVATGHGLPALAIHAYALRAIVVLVGLLALAGVVRRWRAGHRDAVPIVLALSPLVVSFVQPYGGEATFRAYLFACPWLSLLAATAFRPGAPARPRARLSTWGLAVVGVTASTLLIVAYFGLDTADRIDRDDVRASLWFERHAPPGSVLTFAVPNFPNRLTARYARLYVNAGSFTPSLVDDPADIGRFPDGRTVRDVVAQIRETGSATGYIVLSPSQARYAHLYGLLPDGSLGALSKLLEADPHFTSVYRRGAAQIFEYDGRPS